MKKLSPSLHQDAVSLLHQGLSVRAIAARLGIGRSTVSEIGQKTFPEGKVATRGRPSSLTPQLKRLIVRQITTGEQDTASGVQRNMLTDHNIRVSAQTIRNVLKDEGLKSAVKKKKPLLKRTHIRQRLEFARKYQHWTVEDWKRVVWSDETKINRFGSDGRKWCWKKRDSRLQPNHINMTVKHGGGSIMVWGCMTAHGVGYMCRIDGGMDGKLYTEILDDLLHKSVEFYDMDFGDFIFQHDNDPKHTSKIAKEWLANHQVEVLDWPAQSPDLNPIEHLWGYLKRRLESYERAPTSMHELWRRVEEEWEKIPGAECAKLVESMPNRVSEVLKAKGGYTTY